jgi:hypothetical protein
VGAYYFFVIIVIMAVLDLGTYIHYLISIPSYIYRLDSNEVFAVDPTNLNISTPPPCGTRSWSALVAPFVSFHNDEASRRAALVERQTHDDEVCHHSCGQHAD